MKVNQIIPQIIFNVNLHLILQNFCNDRTHEIRYNYNRGDGYDKENNVYKIEGITDSNKIEEGDLVTTTGLTDYFPSGILIGKVSRIVKDEYDLNSIVEVTPSVNFENISIVTVLNRKAEE